MFLALVSQLELHWITDSKCRKTSPSSLFLFLEKGWMQCNCQLWLVLCMSASHVLHCMVQGSALGAHEIPDAVTKAQRD